MADRCVTIERETFVRLIASEMAARHDTTVHQGALDDACPDIDGYEIGDDLQCLAGGPGGECRRLLGDTDTDPVSRDRLSHYSWDTDTYVQWSVGWKPDHQLLAEANTRIQQLEGELAAARSARAGLLASSTHPPARP